MFQVYIQYVQYYFTVHIPKMIIRGHNYHSLVPSQVADSTECAPYPPSISSYILGRLFLDESSGGGSASITFSFTPNTSIPCRAVIAASAEPRFVNFA